ncbi:hypothetical protein B9Z19DRAFT_434795 [Tuber borchii]|uniref:Uncharacterized protein n=1 Tax=Tuber borchii TaxID=42251 RepID=A0A2T6ZGE0_TUBBO|nr:hypothetical protein B9Z19DRAFT_434795 [Tuber borchii]
MSKLGKKKDPQMKPAQHALALSVVGLCGTAYALPHVPYYASRFPQHPQNLGHAGDYPKYWQGEYYTPGEHEAMHYEPASGPASGRPDFTKTKYPAKEAIKYYSGGSFPIKSVEEAANDAIPKPKLENTSSNNIKITNDTPLGPVNNDKSYTRITKSSSHGGPKPAPAVAGKGVVEADDAAGPTASEEDASDDLWNSFSFGVVSDTLNYHDPYEGRKGDYKRKTNAISKIEKMMGKEYSQKEIAEASGTSTPSHSRVRRSEIPHMGPIMRHKPTTHQQFTSIKEGVKKE